MFNKLCLFLLLFSTSAYSAVAGESLLLVTLQSPPAEYIEKGEATGRNVDIVCEALSRMGYEVEINLVPWKRALVMVEYGEADGIIDVAYNAERAEYIYYPEEVLYVEEWYCFKLSENKLTLDENLGNVGEIRLGTSRGFEYGGEIQKAIDNNLFLSIEEVSDNEPNILMLIAGRFDMFVGVKLTILYYLKQLGYQDKIEIIKRTGTDSNYLLNASETYLGFSRKTMDMEIVGEFSTILKEMKNDGTVDKMEKKYY